MKIYLLSLEDGRCVFYSEGPEVIADAEPVEPRGGIRGWAERKQKSLLAILNESEKGVGLRMRRIWEGLQKRIAPDEPMLRSLRVVRALKIYHPQTFTEEETHALWKEYLKSRQGRHTFWFVMNALVSPLTLLLAPLPGPNLIGYWFVYRAICHLLARLGTRNVRKESVSTEYLSNSALDGSFGATDDERIASLALSFGLQGLNAFIMRSMKKQVKTRRKTPLAVS